MKSSFLFLSLLILLLSLPACHMAGKREHSFPNFEEELESLVSDYVMMGAAIGFVDKQGVCRELYFGQLSANNKSTPGPHSVFEIGSITKTFTSLLLARMISQGALELEDEASVYLPEDKVSMPEWEGEGIKIWQLATHCSGLPKSPRESSQPPPPGYDANDPYAAYNALYVYNYLTSYCDLLFEPGTAYAYSNTGMGLIGHILGLVDSSSYSELLEKEILHPLGMCETSLFLSDEQVAALAPGHNNRLDSVRNYHAKDVFQGAGFLKTTLPDMMIFLQAQLGLSESPLHEEIRMTHHSLFDAGEVIYDDREGSYHLKTGMAWHIDSLPDGQVFHSHSGRTSGYMAYMGFDRDSLTGVVILCNQSSKSVIQRFGEEVLDALNWY